MAALVGVAFLGFPIIDRLKKLREKKPAPRPSDSYKEDTIDGVRWRWWRQFGTLKGITPYCVECDHELSWRYTDPMGNTCLHCPKCNTARSKANHRENIHQNIELEIERRARMLDRGEKLPSA